MKMQNRREFLKTSLFSGLAIGGLNLPDIINSQNSAIEGAETESYIAPRSRKPGALALAMGSITGSRYFPLRDGEMNPREVLATDGARIYFLWPSERGQARGYIVRHEESELHDDQIIFRLRQSRPEAPYYLRWKSADNQYFLYTPPGALVKRAAFLIRQQGDENTLQALADLRFAIMLNLTQRGDGQDIIDTVAELDRQVREGEDFSGLWDAYKSLLSKTNPASLSEV
jgi:hypothetical protein